MKSAPASGWRSAPVRLTRDSVSYHYDASVPARATVSSGESVTVETLDARGGALFDRTTDAMFSLPPAKPGQGNPLTGPLAISGAEPGDALLVTVESIDCISPGWCGGHAHVGPFTPGRVPEALGHICPLEDGLVRFSDTIRLPLAPMIGCIGTAPAGTQPPGSAVPGRHGGNLDHTVLRAGTTIYLPVFVSEALLYMGDVHATQGEGELSGVGLEVCGEVTITVKLMKGMRLRWPWAVTHGEVIVMVAHMEFSEARREAVEEMMRILEGQLSLEPAEALALISVAGNLRIGQSFGGMETTVRLEMPASLSISPS